METGGAPGRIGKIDWYLKARQIDTDSHCAGLLSTQQTLSGQIRHSCVGVDHHLPHSI